MDESLFALDYDDYDEGNDSDDEFWNGHAHDPNGRAHYSNGVDVNRNVDVYRQNGFQEDVLYQNGFHERVASDGQNVAAQWNRAGQSWSQNVSPTVVPIPALHSDPRSAWTNQRTRHRPTNERGEPLRIPIDPQPRVDSVYFTAESLSPQQRIVHPSSSNPQSAGTLINTEQVIFNFTDGSSSKSSQEGEFSSLTLRADRFPPSNIPYCEDFIPRDEDKTPSVLRDIHSHAKQIFVVSGGPGHGKTTFAKHVGLEAMKNGLVSAVYFNSFTDYVPGGTRDKSLRRIANAVLRDLENFNCEDPAHALQRFCRSLDPAHRILFVFDNVETLFEENCKIAFCDVLGRMTSGPARNVFVLLTTRDATITHFVEVNVRSAKPNAFVLNVLNSAESRRFLGTFVDDGVLDATKDDHVDAILKECHGNALGLKLCASFLNENFDRPEIVAEFCRDMFGFFKEVGENALPGIISTSFRTLSPEEISFMQMLAVFAGPFSLELAVKMFGRRCFRLLGKMSKKSLINEFKAQDNSHKYTIHPFIRSYCRTTYAPEMPTHYVDFVNIMLKELIQVSINSFDQDAFVLCRKRFLSDLELYEFALKLVCECLIDENEYGVTQADIKEALASLDLATNLNLVVNFLNHSVSHRYFDLLINFLDTISSLFSEITKDGPDGRILQVIVDSYKIHSSDFFNSEAVSSWIAHSKTLLNDPDQTWKSLMAEAYFHYTHGFYLARMNNVKRDMQSDATDEFKAARDLFHVIKKKRKLARGEKGTSESTREKSENILSHYVEMSLAIQLTKSVHKEEVIRGQECLKNLLSFAKSSWGVHPVTMDAEKSLADVMLKRQHYQIAELHYTNAHAMMEKLKVGQEQCTARLLKNMASCMLCLYARDKDKLAQIEELHKEARNLVLYCPKCPLQFDVFCALAVFLQCKGVVLHSKGDEEKARKYAIQAISLAKEFKISSRKMEYRNANQISNGKLCFTVRNVLNPSARTEKPRDSHSKKRSKNTRRSERSIGGEKSESDTPPSSMEEWKDLGLLRLFDGSERADGERRAGEGEAK